MNKYYGADVFYLSSGYKWHMFYFSNAHCSCLLRNKSDKFTQLQGVKVGASNSPRNSLV